MKENSSNCWQFFSRAFFFDTLFVDFSPSTTYFPFVFLLRWIDNSLATSIKLIAQIFFLFFLRTKTKKKKKETIFFMRLYRPEMTRRKTKKKERREKKYVTWTTEISFVRFFFFFQVHQNKTKICWWQIWQILICQKFESVKFFSRTAVSIKEDEEIFSFHQTMMLYSCGFLLWKC